MKTVFVLLLLVLLVLLPCVVVADTPGNCMYDQIAGTWAFSLGSDGHNSGIDCSASFATASTVQVTISYPNIARDTQGNTGTWTMIYNQGFEVTLGQRVFFAFSKYATVNGQVVSYCSETFPGWYHEVNAYAPKNWGCYVGKRLGGPNDGAQVNTLNLPAPEAEAVRRQTLYQHDFDFVDRINKSQSSWTATVYDHHVGLTVGQIESMGGGRIAPGQRTPDWARSYVQLSTNIDGPLAEPRASASYPFPPLNPNYHDGDALPASFDWTNVNGVSYVSPVRSQGQCGSCYAFASMGTVEARIRLVSNNTNQAILSPQEIVSCSEYSQGCDGGFPFLTAGKRAHDFGLVEESCFPYTGQSTSCSRRCTNPRLHYTAEYYYIGGGYYGGCSEAAMKLDLVRNGPIAVSFEVYPDFQQYQGGVYRHTGQVGFNPFELTNHVVVVVGYGETNGQAYWKVKNSWGTSWGLNGYFLIARGVDECAIESIAVGIRPVL